MVTHALPEIGDKPAIGEVTRQQVIATSFGKILGVPDLDASYETYRLMRKHPTLAMARALSVAPVVAAEWSVVSDDSPKAWVDFISQQFLPIREPLVESALFGGIDFGHQGYEKVFDVRDGRLILHKLKPLLQDNTELLVDDSTGGFRGFRQGTIEVPIEKSLLIPFRVEGTQWHGYPLMENARESWNQWLKANAGAARYDERLAGAHWTVHYPVGTSLDENGIEVENSVLAKRILSSLEASSNIAVPQAAIAKDAPLDEEPIGWKIEIMSDGGGRQPAFIDRLNYLDKMLARALLIPERAILEGQYGTKAEAGTHADLAMTHAELQHRHVTRLLNWHAVDQLLVLNFGEQARGRVWLEAGPIRSEEQAQLRSFYASFLANPSGFLQESELIDTDAIRDTLSIPSKEPEDNPTALDGMDTNDKMAALVRRLYQQEQASGGGSNDGGQTTGEAD